MAEPSVCPRCGQSDTGWVAGQVLVHKSDCALTRVRKLEAVIAATKAAVERAKAQMQGGPMSESSLAILGMLIAELESVK